MSETAPRFETLPKVELHVHLEGAIPLPALAELARKYGKREAADHDALRERFSYRDFPHFVEVWNWKNDLLREVDDFTFIAEAVGHDLFSQNVRYAELFYSPPDFADRGLSVGGITEAVRAGFDRVKGIELRLIADLVRDFGAAAAARTLESVADVRDRGVIGIGLGGSEHKFPPELFAAVFERARALGLKTTAHAGEAMGAPSVRAAIDVLRVDRLGHATRAVEDPALVADLKERRIPLEMCPVSNVRTRIVPDLAHHPIRDFFNAGLLVTVNTDDPTMFQTSLAGEFEELQRVHGFSIAEIRRLVANAVEASWLDDGGKARLQTALRAGTP